MYWEGLPGLLCTSAGRNGLSGGMGAGGKAPRWHRIWQVFKIVFVALLCFAGGAFSIMAFHNDISITDLFRQLYELVMGEKSSGCTILEMSYSIGLMVGIILFIITSESGGSHRTRHRLRCLCAAMKGSDRSDDICLGQGGENDRCGLKKL